jgi:hypothetical protein
MHQNDKIPNTDEIDIRELFLLFWNKKIDIIVITTIAAVISIVYSLTLTNIYTSQAILAPATNDKSLTTNFRGYSALAGFAGVSLPATDATKSEEAIQRVRSFEFFDNYFLPNVKYENVVAVKKWLPNKNAIVYDSSLFNADTGKWANEDPNSEKTIPSRQDAFAIYKNMLKISEEKNNSFVILSINHSSPTIAKKWVDVIVKNINESMREIDIKNAQSSIKFLNESTKSMNIQSIKEVISSLLESQMQILMFASSSNDYVFKVIDSPIVPEKKSSPNRALICILGTILGGFLGLLYVLFQSYRKII